MSAKSQPSADSIRHATGRRPPSEGLPLPEGGFCEEVAHVADVALRCSGPDLETFFRTATWGLYHLMGAAPQPGKAGARRSVSLAAEDLESLLVEWLGELVYLAETASLVFGAVEFRTLAPTRIDARLSDGRAAHFERYVKAVTYHDLQVIATPDGYAATIVFDV
jgi:SHS2 domain-containing protein